MDQFWPVRRTEEIDLPIFFFGSCGNESYALPSKQRFADQSAKSLKHFSITIDHAAENELAQIGIVIKYTV